MMKDNEKLVAFLALLVVVVIVTLLSTNIDLPKVGDKTSNEVALALMQGKLALLNIAVGGVVATLGAAAQSLFRHSQTEQDVAAAAKATAEKVPPKTGEARAAEQQDELPPMLRDDA